MGVRFCLPEALTDLGDPASLVSGFPVCLHNHRHGKPPGYGHSDL